MPLDGVRPPPGRVAHDEVVGEHDALLGGEAAEGEADDRARSRRRDIRSGRPNSTASSR